MPEFNGWAGVITGTITPFTADGSIDWASLERHLNCLNRAGLIGILANAMMAEGQHLSSDERARILKFMVERSRPESPIIATIYGMSTDDAAEQAYQAAQLGARALLVFPHPAFAGLPLDPQIPTSFFRAIWERASLPMIVFRLPPERAPSLDLEALKHLAEVPGVVAVKDSAADPAFYEGEGATLLAADAPLKVLIDDDAKTLGFLKHGAHGATSICATVDPQRYVALFDRRHQPEALAIDDRLRTFSSAVFAAPRRDFRARIKEALVLDGVIKTANVRAPLQPLSEAERQSVAAALRASRDSAKVYASKQPALALSASH